MAEVVPGPAPEAAHREMVGDVPTELSELAELKEHAKSMKTTDGQKLKGMVAILCAKYRRALLALASGDGTPGPAPEGAKALEHVEGCLRHNSYPNGPPQLNLPRQVGGIDVNKLRVVIDLAHVALASGDSVGPREAAPDDLVSARWEILALTRQLDEWAKRYAALRAELGRAPNGWEEAAKIVDNVAETHGRESATRATLERVAAALRARADAELGRGGTSEPSERERALTAALQNLISAHDGYRHGVGPCICAAHEDARAILADAERPPQETK